MNGEKNTLSPELSDEDPDRVAGGYGGPTKPCPDCGSTKYSIWKGNDSVCPDCGHVYLHKVSGSRAPTL